MYLFAGSTQGSKFQHMYALPPEQALPPPSCVVPPLLQLNFPPPQEGLQQSQ
jgi:hypothetical protein